MKAATYRRNGPPDVFEYVDVPDPVCAPNGVVVQVEAISIEGGDTLNRLGGAMVGERHIVGYQCAGTVIEVGADAAGGPVAVGDRVVATMPHGSHAELVAVPTAALWMVPDGADLTAVACVPIAFGTADDCLFEFGRLQAGETVLVQAGAGGVGIAAVQLAKRAGATVLATASSTARLARSSRSASTTASTTPRPMSRPRCAGSPTGGVRTWSSTRSAAPPWSAACGPWPTGAVASPSATPGATRSPSTSRSLMGGNQSLTGVFLGAELAFARAHAIIGELIEDVAAGRLQVVVDRTFPLAEAAAAHAYFESRQAFGRVVLVP